MRDRHFPRLCRACDAPMARQEGSCWRCGEQWVDKSETTGDSPAATAAGPAAHHSPDAGDTRVPALAGAGDQVARSSPASRKRSSKSAIRS